MILNASFNIFYCFIMILKLGNECIFYYWSIFCSSIYQSELMQYFKIIMVQFLGNTFRTCGSLSYLAFSLSRFVLISEELKKSPFLVKFSKIKIKHFVIMFLTLGSLISCYKIFQYKNNELNLPFMSFPLEKYDNKYCKYKSSYECKLFDALKSIDIALNDIIFLILSIFLDIFLFKTFKKEMTSKKKLLNASKYEELKKKQDDVIKMVIINGLIYVGSHLPLFISSVLLIVFSKKISNFCSHKYSCDIINEITKFFCVISMFLQFFIYFRFNYIFRNSFWDIKERIFKKK